jgi:hypothetical protein
MVEKQEVPYRKPVEADVEGDTVDGIALFDADLEYPCRTLILSIEHGLTLKWHEADNRFIRIGIVGWYGYERKWNTMKRAFCAAMLPVPEDVVKKSSGRGI